MKVDVLDTRSVRMLELLAQGASSKEIARDLGYQDGTMRVYLHNLYRKLGVANKTAAVIWYMKRRAGASEPAAAIPQKAAAAEPTSDPVGDMALAEGLYATLGVMGSCVGPWSRVWEAGAKAAGDDSDPERARERTRTRALWNMLMRGDFVEAKAMYDTDEGFGIISGPTLDGILLASLMVAGGFSHAANYVFSRLVDRRRARPAIAAREVALLEAAFAAFQDKDPGSGLTRLQKAVDAHTQVAMRHLALALLFHAARVRRDPERARLAANTLWAEAQAAASDLKGAGGIGAAGSSKRATAKASPRERATA